MLHCFTRIMAVHRYREIARARAECIDSGVCDANDAVIKNFTRFILKVSLQHCVCPLCTPC